MKKTPNQLRSTRSARDDVGRRSSSFILHPSSFILPKSFILLAAAGLAFGKPAPEVEGLAADERVVREAGIGTDGAALLAFFRQRALDEADRRRVELWVGRLGSERFAEREEATRQLVGRGPAVRPFLQAALRDPDPEVARRAARCLEEIDAGPGPALPTAAARLLARQAPAGTAEALLAYVPFADDASVAEEVLAALLLVTPGDRPVEEFLTKALADPRPVVRGAAARVVGHKGDAAQRAAVRGLLADRDWGVRLQAGQGLLASRDRLAVPALIEVAAEAPLDPALRAEELLCLLAGEQAPALSVHDAEKGTRQKCREMWLAWWEKNGGTADLGRALDGRRLLGLTLGIEYNTGRVWERSHDGTLRWEVTNLAGPMEAQVLPGGRVLIAEANNRTVSERDRKGAVLWSRQIDAQPTGCQRLANGNTFVSTYTGVMEFSPAGKVVYAFKLPQGSNAIRKHKNGHVVFAADDRIVEVDTAGNTVRTVPLPRQSMYVGIHDLAGDHFLVANSSNGRVLEVDARGKVVWEGKVDGACGVWRLPTGNTLVSTNGRVVELGRAGAKVAEIAAAGYVRRVHRR